MWYHHVVSGFWTPEKIENYKQASEYSAFHKKLSVLAAPYLDERWTLADIGSGPGLLAIWLSPMVAGIDAIDSDPAAIEDLKARLDDVFLTDAKTAEKIRPRLASYEDIKGESWDAVVLCFFGVSEEVLAEVLPLAGRRAFIFMHGRPEVKGPLASPGDGAKFSAADMEAWLIEKNYAFKKNVMEMQFGQPFKTLEDIHGFLASYGDDAVKEMTDIEERITRTNRFDYPYYLPKSLSVALFIVQTG